MYSRYTELVGSSRQSSRVLRLHEHHYVWALLRLVSVPATHVNISVSFALPHEQFQFVKPVVVTLRYARSNRTFSGVSHVMAVLHRVTFLIRILRVDVKKLQSGRTCGTGCLPQSKKLFSVRRFVSAKYTALTGISHRFRVSRVHGSVYLKYTAREDLFLGEVSI